MRITLLRHGKPAYELKGNVRARDLGEIARLYDSSGIVGSPPSQTIAAVKRDSLVVCSHLERSVESAKALGFTEIHLSDALFCEAAIPYFGGGSITLPIRIWVVILRIMWLFGFSRNGESFASTKKRATEAASRLAVLSTEHQDVLLVGHGFINHFIAKALLKNGWSGPSTPSKQFWGFGIYERSAT